MGEGPLAISHTAGGKNKLAQPFGEYFVTPIIMENVHAPQCSSLTFISVS